MTTNQKIGIGLGTAAVLGVTYWLYRRDMAGAPKAAPAQSPATLPGIVPSVAPAPAGPGTVVESTPAIPPPTLYPTSPGGLGLPSVPSYGSLPGLPPLESGPTVNPGILSSASAPNLSPGGLLSAVKPAMASLVRGIDSRFTGTGAGQMSNNPLARR